MAILALWLAGCGGAATSSLPASGTGSTPSANRQPPTRAAPPAHLVYRQLFHLHAGVQDAAGAALGGESFVLLGGLTAADVSTDAVLQASLRGPRRITALPNAQHDAQAVTLGATTYLFGGGQFHEYDHILAYDPATASVRQVGTLPRPASDVAVAASGATAYIVGGYDGARWLDTILAWSPGRAPRVAGRLPVPLRYAAAAFADGYLLIAGGTSPTGTSRAVYRFDPRSGAIVRVGQLPHPLTHAGAGAVGSTAFIVGGRGNSSSSRTDQVLAVSPSTGGVRRAGTLPQPLSDATVVSLPGRLVVAGGSSPAGVLTGVGELDPTR